jgi:hypothetical protein
MDAEDCEQSADLDDAVTVEAGCKVTISARFFQELRISLLSPVAI